MEWETTPFLTKIQLERLSKMKEIAERLRKARTLQRIAREKEQRRKDRVVIESMAGELILDSLSNELSRRRTLTLVDTDKVKLGGS